MFENYKMKALQLIGAFPKSSDGKPLVIKNKFFST